MTKMLIFMAFIACLVPVERSDTSDPPVVTINATRNVNAMIARLLRGS